MIEYIAFALAAIGAIFLLLAAVGVARMPDLFARMHATTKAATLGSSLILLAVVVYFADVSVAVRALAILIFLFMTAPVVAHLLGRAARITGIPLSEYTVIDEFDVQNYRAAKSTNGRAIEPEAEDGQD